MDDKQNLGQYRFQLSENETQHHSYADEQTFSLLIRDCDVDSIFDFYDHFPKELIGQMAVDPVKQQEYFTVLSISLMVRAAIDAGLDPYEGYNLNDIYLQRTSMARSISEYESILRESIRSIVEKLKRHRSVHTKSIYVKRAREYVSKHISKKFSLTDIAHYVGISPSRLSVLFSETEHQTLRDYVLEQRINTAKEMLRHTDYPISAIANYLCFSSHSHFSAVFKQRIGMTPREYREEFYSE